jgi:hypothetical protein
MKRISPHLGRGPDEPTDAAIEQFYDKLLTILKQPALRCGKWQLLECSPAWDGNWTHDCFIVFTWQDNSDQRLVVAVNYSDHQSQCHVSLPLANLTGHNWQLIDQLSDSSFHWSGDDLAGRGLYLDMAPWQACAFTFRPA